MRLLRLLPLALLAACGQSGDLYLPAEQPPPPATEQAAPPAEEPADKKDPPKPKEAR